ncbi:hypothetical protein, partial [Nocardioides sp. YIM 152588]|uniref:hypothetical protein n=1 Tax=Nocardioides sp. YIM 152588 TaxID=3158259 RepID=UPI0032E52CEA
TAAARAAAGKAAVRSAAGRPWPVRRITYRETIPAKWQWGVKRAVKAWKKSGVKVRFVKAKGGAAPQLTITYGATGGRDADATLGYAPGRQATVRLAKKFRSKPANAKNTVLVGRLLTQQLGRVLGLGESAKACSLMNPNPAARCSLLSARTGFYQCRWIDRATQRAAARRYGGTVKLAPKTCPIYPLPGALRTVAFSGGAADESPVAITWKRPKRLPAQSEVLVEAWSGTTCPDTTAADRTAPDLRARVTVTDRRWVDSTLDRHGDGPFCYAVSAVNRVGGGQPAETAVLERFQEELGPPQITNPRLAAGPDGRQRWLLDASWAGDHLEAYVDGADPATCVTPSGAGDDPAWLVSRGSEVAVPVAATTMCVTYLAVSRWGAASDPTSVTLEVPAPPAPVVGQPTYLGNREFSIPVTHEAGYTLRLGAFSGTCDELPKNPYPRLWWGTSDSSAERLRIQGDEACAVFVYTDDRFGFSGEMATVALRTSGG